MFDDDENDLDKHRKLPIYKKAEEIYELVSKIADLIPDDDDSPLAFTKANMLGDAMLIMAKISGAEAGDLYDIRMENAAMIRRAAHDLKITNHSLEMHGFEHVEYYNLVRDLIEEFRLLFIDWVSGFDKWNYIIDRWGLFNPPGVGPHDKDPDDDIPFNPEDFLDDNL